MICENPGCHCQSEFGVMRDGQIVCSVLCTPLMTGIDDLCPCGHPGCGSSQFAADGFFNSIGGALMTA